MSGPTAEAPERTASRAEAQAGEDEGRARPTSAPLLQQFETLYAAAAALTIALKRFFGALGRLLLAESAVVRHGVPLLVIGFIALIAMSVSLWACTVALIFWALRLGTHSSGIALGIIVAGHLLLIVGLWVSIKRGVQQASFPQARAEMRALGRQLAQDFDEFAHHAPSRKDLQP
jgi:hypothetical protein